MLKLAPTRSRGARAQEPGAGRPELQPLRERPATLGPRWSRTARERARKPAAGPKVPGTYWDRGRGGGSVCLAVQTFLEWRGTQRVSWVGDSPVLSVSRSPTETLSPARLDPRVNSRVPVTAVSWELGSSRPRRALPRRPAAKAS